jgi:hypothetical protein
VTTPAKEGSAVVATSDRVCGSDKTCRKLAVSDYQVALA